MTTSSRQRATARSRAEDEFLAAQKKNKKVLEQKEQQREEKAQHVAKLKGQRLAKEAAAQAEADQAEAVKPAKKKKKSGANLPQFHRF